MNLDAATLDLTDHTRYKPIKTIPTIVKIAAILKRVRAEMDQRSSWVRPFFTARRAKTVAVIRKKIPTAGWMKVFIKLFFGMNAYNQPLC